ncbi:MAG: hypothetical protein AB3N15_07245 [Paracoccaceae bacterium]
MTRETDAAARLETLQVLRDLTEKRATSDRAFRRAIGTLAEDIDIVFDSLARDPNAWRLNRAFHTVHVPSMIAAFSMLDESAAMQSASDEEKHQILASVSRAASLARAARHKIEQVALTDAKIELDVLASYAKPPATPFKKSSMFTRALDNVSDASQSAWESTKSTVSAIPDLSGSIQDGLAGAMSRLSSVPKLAGNLQKTVSGSVSDVIIQPVSMRLNAGGRAVGTGVGAGVGLGVVIGVLCPPLLPLTAGGAVLAAMRTWRKEMDNARALNEAEREQRIVQLKAERTAALMQLTQGADALQMESDELSLTLDVETGEADAVILDGEYSGRTWSSLTSVEKAEVATGVAAASFDLLRILDLDL